MAPNDGPTGGQHMFTLIPHPELNVLGSIEIHTFLCERERYLLRIKDANDSGNKITPISIKYSIETDLLLSLIDLGELGDNVTSIDDVDDDFLREWLRSKDKTQTDTSSLENIETAVDASVSVNVHKQNLGAEAPFTEELHGSSSTPNTNTGSSSTRPGAIVGSDDPSSKIPNGPTSIGSSTSSDGTAESVTPGILSNPQLVPERQIESVKLANGSQDELSEAVQYAHHDSGMESAVQQVYGEVAYNDPAAASNNPQIAKPSERNTKHWSLSLSDFSYILFHVPGDDYLWAHLLSPWAASDETRPPRYGTNSLFQTLIAPHFYPDVRWPGPKNISDARAAALKEGEHTHPSITTDISRYKVGDHVLSQRVAKERNKLRVKWHGPLRITRVLSDFVFECQDLIKLYRALIHAKRLKFYVDSMPDATAELLDTTPNNDLHLHTVTTLPNLRLNPTSERLECLAQRSGFPRKDPSWESFSSLRENILDMLGEFLDGFHNSLSVAARAPYAQHLRRRIIARSTWPMHGFDALGLLPACFYLRASTWYRTMRESHIYIFG